MQPNKSHTKAHSLATAPATGAVVLAFLAIYFIWGSTYVAIRFAIETLPPFTMAGIRFLLAGMALFGWTTATGAGWPQLIQWRSALVIGTLLLVSGNGLLSWAEAFVPSGVAALIVATVPLWIVVLDAFRTRERPSTPVITGLVLGLFGLVVLIGPSDLGGTPINPMGAFAISFAAFSWALGSIYSRSAPQRESTLQNVGMQMLLGGVLLLILGAALGEQVVPTSVSARSLWALIYLASLGGVVSYSAYVWLLKVSTPSKVATYAYVNPVVAVFLGWALAGEALGPRVGLAAAAVIGAVVLMSRAPKAAAPK